MKRFRLHGNNANWKNGLRMSALNLRTLKEETSTPMNGARVYVNVATNVYHVKDYRREVLNGEISDSDRNAIVNAIRNDTPDFLLTLEGNVVGYANLYRNGRRETTDTTPISAADILDDIVDGETLALLIIPATDTTPAVPKDKPKEELKPYYVTQVLTINVIEPVKAASREEATAKATDIRAKIEEFLDENFAGDYGTSDYNIYVNEVR